MNLYRGPGRYADIDSSTPNSPVSSNDSLYLSPMSISQKSSKGSLNSLIDKTKNMVIEHHHHYHEPEKVQNLPLQEDVHQKNILAAKTRAFRKYSKKLVPQIFNPDAYEQMVNGIKPTESPLLAALHDFHKSSYLTPLPSQAYERQIDVDNKYIREGQYVYGAQ